MERKDSHWSFGHRSTTSTISLNNNITQQQQQHYSTTTKISLNNNVNKIIQQPQQKHKQHQQNYSTTPNNLNTQQPQHPTTSTPNNNNNLNTQQPQHPTTTTPNNLNTQQPQHPTTTTTSTLNNLNTQQQQRPTTSTLNNLNTQQQHQQQHVNIKKLTCYQSAHILPFIFLRLIYFICSLERHLQICILTILHTISILKLVTFCSFVFNSHSHLQLSRQHFNRFHRDVFSSSSLSLLLLLIFFNLPIIYFDCFSATSHSATLITILGALSAFPDLIIPSFEPF